MLDQVLGVNNLNLLAQALPKVEIPLPIGRDFHDKNRTEIKKKSDFSSLRHQLCICPTFRSLLCLSSVCCYEAMR
jgi:hypothetical protein